MPTTDGERVLEVLDEPECRRLLGTVRVGRLGFTDGALPAILPVGFAVDGDSVRIPVHEGIRVLDALRSAVVAFAVDAYDVVDRTGWSVTVVGPSRVLPGAEPAGTVIVVRMGLFRGWRSGYPVPPAARPAAGTGA